MSFNPIFKFIDNKSARQYEIYEDGLVKFKENCLWPSHTDQIGLVINNIPKRFNEIRNDEKILAEASRRFKECTETEKQMTREEALEKLNNLRGLESSRASNIKLIETLEALGLIKFKEEGKQYDTRTIIFSSTAPCAYQAISQLEALGYEIIKKS